MSRYADRLYFYGFFFFCNFADNVRSTVAPRDSSNVVELEKANLLAIDARAIV